MRVKTRPGVSGLAPEIDLVPMIDVLLVLIVIFMVMQRRWVVMDFEVPAEATAATVPVSQIVLQLRDDGSYGINGTTVPRELLERRLAELYRDRAVKVLFIQAARSRAYEEVIEATDAAKAAGVRVVGLLPSGASADSR